MVTREAKGPTTVAVASVALGAATLALVTSNMLATLLLDRVDDDTWNAFEESSAQLVEDARALGAAIVR